MTKLEIIYLLIILAFGSVLRTYGLNWDNGQHLHPDERAIVMIAERIHWPAVGEWSKVLTAESPLNPKFFAYGSLPIYFLKFAGYIGSYFDKTLAQYDKMNLLGRVLSALFDTGTILTIYLITKKLLPHRPTLPIFAILFYAASVLPIQLSHFYAVDTSLNFFIIVGIYLCIKYFERPSNKYLTALGIVLGLSFTTKFTGAFLLPPILLTLLLITFREGGSLSKRVIRFLFRLSFFTLIFTLSAFVFMPYAFLDFSTFKSNIAEQLRMSSDPYVFPFTLQYVNSTPYIYPVQQIFLWGLGPVISVLSAAGFLFIPKVLKASPCRVSWLIFLIFNLTYFVILGNSSVKFMRYYLPLYPLLAILAAYFIDTFLTRAKLLLGQRLTLTMAILLVFISLLWPLSFVNIYSKPNTRVSASEWINQNIRGGSVLAVEHWDDRLPLPEGEKYNFVEMPMYDPDNSETKWQRIDDNLKRADYIILASNRIYVPLQKLTDCPKIKYAWRCYPKTDKYYHDLFSGNLGFTKAAEFTNYPELSFLNYQLSIDDSLADENFTVFDHPKILIFKKI